MAERARKANPDRQIVIGDRTYTLRYSLRAMIALQDHYGLESLDEVGRRLTDTARLGAMDMAVVLWAGLRTHHPEVSIDEAIDILDEAGIQAMESIMGDAFGAASGDGEDGQAAEGPRRPGRSTG